MFARFGALPDRRRGGCHCRYCIRSGRARRTPLDAVHWAVGFIGEAGRRSTIGVGPLGFLARERSRHVPRLMKAI